MLPLLELDLEVIFQRLSFDEAETIDFVHFEELPVYENIPSTVADHNTV